MSRKSPRTPLIRPKEYFEHTYDAFFPGLGVFAVYVITTIALLWSAVSILLGQVEDAPSGIESAMGELMITTAFLYIITSIIVLLIIAALLHYLCGGRHKSENSFGDAIAVAGWAYAPNVLFAPLTYVNIRHELSQYTFDGSDTAAMETQFEAAQSDPMGVGTILLLLVTVAWSVYILGYGTAGEYQVEVSDAMVPAIIIGIGAIFFGLV